MIRSSSRARLSLLASTSFVAVNVLAGAGALTATAFAPSVALAACADNGATAVIEVCSPPDPVNQSLTYKAAANTALQLIDVDVTENATHGIFVDPNGFDFGVTFNTVGGPVSTIAVTGGGNGIFLQGAGGDLSVTTVDFDLLTNTDNDQNNTITTDGSYGIRIDNQGTGDSKVVIGADTITAGGQGVHVSAANGGDTTVIVNAGANISGGTRGVVGRSVGTGDATVTIAGTLTGTNASIFGAAGALQEGAGTGDTTLTLLAGADVKAITSGDATVSGAPATFLAGTATLDIQTGATAGAAGGGRGAVVTGAVTSNLTVAGTISDGGAVVNGKTATANVSGAITGGANDGLNITATTGAATLNQTAGTITGSGANDGVEVTSGAGGAVLNLSLIHI